MKPNIDLLLARYFGGSSTPQDLEALEQWLASSPLNELEFERLTTLYQRLRSPQLEMAMPNTAVAKAKFMAYMLSEKQTVNIKDASFPKTILFKRWMLVAASVALILSLSIVFWKLPQAQHDVVFATQAKPLQRVLSDQTEVKLSELSKITYSSNYGNEAKNIFLEGEASFEVGHAGNGTLRVCADETFIEDIGTVFEVSAYPDSSYISVKVSTGQVHFYTKTNKGLVIAANETGVYDKKTKTFKLLVPSVESIEKIGMHANFNAMILSEVVEIITKVYHVDIRFADPNIAMRKITVNFDGENLDMVLQIIAETLDLTILKEENTYLLRNKKFNAQ